MTGIIHVLERQSDLVVAVFQNQLYNKIFWGDVHHDSINNFETYDFFARADVEGSKYLTGQNRIVIPADKPNTFREFIIFNTHMSSDGNIEVRSNGSYIELAGQKMLTAFNLGGQTAEQAMSYGLQGTDWQVGTVEYAGVQTVISEDRMNAYEYLLYIAELFDMQLDFRVEILGNRIIGRYVDLLHNVGSNTGKEIILGKDLIGITRKQSTDEVITALLAEGPPAENGARISVALYDEEAVQRWGRNGRHIWGYLEVPAPEGKELTIEMVEDAGNAELQRRIAATIEYTVDAVSLEHIFGLSHEKALKGDQVRIKDTSFEPPLYLDARLIDVKRSQSDPKAKVFTLGEFVEYTENDVMRTFRILRNELARKIGRDEVAVIVEEGTIVRSPIAPENPKTHQLWMDTSRIPNVLYRWNGTEWVRASPTSPGDIGAPTFGDVDTKVGVAKWQMEISTAKDIHARLSTQAQALLDNPDIVNTDPWTLLTNEMTNFDNEVSEFESTVNDAIADTVITSAENSSLTAAREQFNTQADVVIRAIRGAEDEVIAQKMNQVVEFGDRKIFKGSLVPDPAETEELDLWLDARVSPPVWRQLINSTWVQVSRTNLSDMQGLITETQITENAVTAPKLAANSVVARNIAANVINSNMIVTAGLDAGVLKFGIATGITVDVTQAGITADGTLSTSVRFWAGTSYNNRANAPFRVLQDGAVYASNLHISGGTFTGGTITGATIDVGTDINVGQNIYLKKDYANRFDKKGLFMYPPIHGDGYETSVTGTYLGMDLRSRNISLYSDVLDFWNTQIRFGDTTNINFNGPEPKRSTTEKGFMGIGGGADGKPTGSSFIGVGVNFRYKKSYVPSSVGQSQTSSNLQNSGMFNVTDINADGFWLYLTGYAGSELYYYWRGTYNC